MNPENHLEWCRELYHTPVRRSAWEDPFFGDPKFEAFRYEIPRARAQFYGDIATLNTPIVVEGFDKTIIDILEGKVAIRDGLTELAGKIEKIIEEIGL